MAKRTPGFRLEFETDNAAFDDGNRAAEVSRILRIVANDVDQGRKMGGSPVFDSNGNRVGSWEMTPTH